VPHVRLREGLRGLLGLVGSLPRSSQWWTPRRSIRTQPGADLQQRLLHHWARWHGPVAERGDAVRHKGPDGLRSRRLLGACTPLHRGVRASGPPRRVRRPPRDARQRRRAGGELGRLRVGRYVAARLGLVCCVRLAAGVDGPILDAGVAGVAHEAPPAQLQFLERHGIDVASTRRALARVAARARLHSAGGSEPFDGGEQLAAVVEGSPVWRGLG